MGMRVGVARCWLCPAADVRGHHLSMPCQCWHPAADNRAGAWASHLPTSPSYAYPRLKAYCKCQYWHYHGPVNVTIRYRRDGQPWQGGTATYSHTRAVAIVCDAIRTGHARFDTYMIEAAPCLLTDADRARLANLRRRASAGTRLAHTSEVSR